MSIAEKNAQLEQALIEEKLKYKRLMCFVVEILKLPQNQNIEELIEKIITPNTPYNGE